MHRKLLKLHLFIFPFPLVGLFFLTPGKGWAVFSAVLISAVSIQLSAWVIERFWKADWEQFSAVYFFSMALRFLLVVGVMAILLGVSKIDEIYFTVSFIISYLCYSVTEMIFFHKILQERPLKK